MRARIEFKKGKMIIGDFEFPIKGGAIELRNASMYNSDKQLVAMFTAIDMKKKRRVRKKKR